MSTERVLRNTAATVTVTFYSGTTAVEADGVVTVVALKADGTTLFSTNATNEPATGVYSTVIPAQSNLNNLTLTWSGLFTGTAISLQTNVEIVGGFYFSLAELRAYDSSLANATRFPNEVLIAERTNVEAEFELITDRAFVPRFNAEYVAVEEYENEIWLDRTDIRAINKFTVNGVDYLSWVTAGYIKNDLRESHRLYLFGPAASLIYSTYRPNIYIEYEYGTAQVPRMISEKAKKRAKGNLIGLASTIDPRATTMNIPDVGFVNLSTPGQRGSQTGIPDIDVILEKYSRTSSLGGAY